MFSLIRTWQALKKRGVVGVNGRNADYIIKYNRRKFYPFVDNKIITKERAIAAGMGVPELYGVVRTEHEVKALKTILGGRTDFVVKPAQGSGGDGIVVIADRFSDTKYKTVSGGLVRFSELQYQISNILTGLYSLGGNRDCAIIEYRVRPDPVFSAIMYEGVADIRIIVLMGYPVMAMLRLPTRISCGKANLHQGAIGVGVSLATGMTLNGTWFNDKIDRHPDTGNPVAGIVLPRWREFINFATRSYELSGLGYIGVDLVLDAEYGPMILELNARPGLNIQIANDDGLRHRAALIEDHIRSLPKGETESSEKRAEFSLRHFV